MIDVVLLGSPKLPPHLEMFNHVEAASMLCDSASITSDVSSSTDDRDTLSQDIARDLGVTPLVCTGHFTVYYVLMSQLSSAHCSLLPSFCCSLSECFV